MRDSLDHLSELVRTRRVDLDAILIRIVDESVRRLRADRGTLYLVDRARAEVVSRVGHLPEIQVIRLRMGEGVAGWVAQTGTVVNVPRGTQDPRFTRRIDEQTGYQTRSLLAAPIRDTDGHTIGVLQLLNKQGGEFPRSDEATIVELSATIAQLLAQSSLGSQLSAAPAHPLSFRYNHIIGDCDAMHRVYDRTTRAARTMATVMIRGESGTGKELIARAVHDNSARAERPFVVADLAAMPHHLMENELFGHKRGAFTGADRDAKGRVAQANGGTLFLDEIGELPLPVQAKLLRLLQERTYTPIGAPKPVRVDLRFVCATHRDLEQMVTEGRFREDLYYRVRVVEIRVPPLRRRGAADLDRLIDHFLFELARRHGRPGTQLSAGARAALHAHPWPGNVRELQHALESAVVLAPGDVIAPDQLSLVPREGVTALQEPAPPPQQTDAAPNFVTGPRPLKEVELDYIRFMVDRCGGNRSLAARRLGIGRNTLLRKLKSGEP